MHAEKKEKLAAVVNGVIGMFGWHCYRHVDRACATWEQILYECPTDAFVARLLQNGYYFLGANEAMRDSAARILPYWSPSQPLYGYLLGIYSFGLCETRDFDNAMLMAKKVSHLMYCVCPVLYV